MAGKILLIEEDPDIRSLLAYNLGKEGFEVLASPRGRDLIGLCRKEQPDLVILEVVLPDADGLAICKELQTQPDLRHIPIFFLTTRATEREMRLGLECCAREYITKPFSVRQLIGKIKRHLASGAEETS